MSKRRTNTTDGVYGFNETVASEADFVSAGDIEGYGNVTGDTSKKESKAKMTEAEMDAITNETAKALAKQPKVRVKLFQTKPPEKPLPDVTVTVNGYNYLIKRGEVVEVPQTVAEILEHAGHI